MPQSKHILGRTGESVALAHLESLGYRVLTTNYRCPVGEADIVALDGGILVFVEVKTRSLSSRGETSFGEPAERVDSRKMARLRAVASHYVLTHYPRAKDGDVSIRFDVVCVIRSPRGFSVDVIRGVSA
ncbi:MAG TPA: YraN family protein [Clostridia bacterium]|nr:YraN family protein [Clostridia bacterium]